MKSKQARISLALAGSIVVAAAAFAQPTTDKSKDAAKAPAAASKPVKVTVNGVTIPQSRFDFVAKAQAAQGQAPSPQSEQNIREQLITVELLSQEAAKTGLDKQPETQTQLEMARQNILARAYQQHYIKTAAVKDDVLKAEYERVKAQVGEKEYKPQHILVEKEETAKEIIAQLKKGGDFDKIAKEKSTDTGSKENGGKLEWSNISSFVKPFSDAMVKLNKGEYTAEPVKTQFGYHIIKLEDVRPSKIPPFDDVKENIRQNEVQKQFQKVIADLRAKAKIEEK
jgi:peptidyl-prolyl cis-trans isomerase C